MSTKPGALAVLLLAAAACAQAQSKPIEPNGPAQQPNTQKTYSALRSDLPGADGVSVKDLTLTREGGAFHFDSGDFYFYTPVDGHITGAVFTGKGRFDLTVKDAGEQPRTSPATTART